MSRARDLSRQLLQRTGLYERSLTWRDKARGMRVPAEERRSFDEVEAYCMFVGYPRSGHSLTGSLLDAHPDMVVSHELDALRLVDAGIKRDGLYSTILRSEREFNARGRRWQGYTYNVEGQWQGRTRRLRVIGDKKGGISTERLGRDPQLLGRLQRLVGVPVRIVHVVRNPFDNIATMSLRHHRSLEDSVEWYLRLCRTVERIKAGADAADWLDIRHEDVVEKPHESLRRLCSFLGVEPDDDYLDACAAVVFESPNKSRNKVTWTPELVREVETSMAAFPFLDGYTFDT